jgi:hypothetical protein
MTQRKKKKSRLKSEIPGELLFSLCKYIPPRKQYSAKTKGLHNFQVVSALDLHHSSSPQHIRNQVQNLGKIT